MANSSKNKTWADLVKIMPFRGIFMVSMVSSFCHLLTSGLVTYWYQRVYFRTEFSIEFQKCPSWVLDLELVFTWQKWSRAQRKGVGSVVRLNLRVPIPEDVRPCTLLFHSSNDKYRLISICVCSSGRVAREISCCEVDLYLFQIYIFRLTRSKMSQNTISNPSNLII